MHVDVVREDMEVVGVTEEDVKRYDPWWRQWHSWDLYGGTRGLAFLWGPKFSLVHFVSHKNYFVFVHGGGTGNL